MAIEARICPDSDGECAPRSLDVVVAALAARQHGVVSRTQLLAAGVGRGAIDRRVAGGRLHPVHRGVFAVGHRVLSGHGAWMAAVLGAGPDAVLSYRSAAALWGIRDTARARIEITVPRHRRGRPGVEYHELVLPPDEIDCHRAIPVTNPARTLFDLAAVVSEQQLEHALNEAEIRRLTSPLSLDALLARYPRRSGTAAIRRALEKHRQIGETVTKSTMERRFLELLDAHHIRRPTTNQPLGPYFPDALWPAERLVVELDSYDIHTTRQAFENDRERDRNLTTAGYRVIRISWRQLTREPATIANQLRTLLTADPRPR